MLNSINKVLVCERYKFSFRLVFSYERDQQPDQVPDPGSGSRDLSIKNLVTEEKTSIFEGCDQKYTGVLYSAIQS